MGIFKRKGASTPGPMGGASWLAWPTIAWGGLQEVVGESYRQHELQQIAQVRPGVGPTNRLVMAQIVREPNNEHDKNAVKVLVGGVRVGYLPRDEARSAHGLIDSLTARGLPATCRAEIIGGTPGKPSLGITLHAQTWVPFVEGTPFLDGSRVSSVSVTKEEKHQEALERVLGATGGQHVVATLGSAPDNSIGVFIGPDLIGQLTKTMTERHTATLWAAYEAGFTCTCFAFLERDAKNIIQVKLMLLKLPD
jgi:hypothetical protein